MNFEVFFIRDTAFHFESGEPPLKVTDVPTPVVEPPKSSKFDCENCKKSFKSSGHLKRHVVVHSDEKQHQCLQCPKSFNQSDNLKTHMKTVHSSEKKYKCNECSKMFSLKGTLKTHEKTHDSTKAPFKCEIDDCSKRFVQKSLYEAHKRVHSGEKPFKCGKCDSAFARQSTLHNHQKIKTH
jgi:KRAB domain-containing zinc finger protein